MNPTTIVRASVDPDGFPVHAMTFDVVDPPVRLACQTVRLEIRKPTRKAKW
jgi:hypothetical protein